MNALRWVTLYLSGQKEKGFQNDGLRGLLEVVGGILRPTRQSAA
jgi:hypothetical protein